MCLQNSEKNKALFHVDRNLAGLLKKIAFLYNLQNELCFIDDSCLDHKTEKRLNNVFTEIYLLSTGKTVFSDHNTIHTCFYNISPTFIYSNLLKKFHYSFI